MPQLENALIFCASSPLMVKILGPTADYLGKGLQKFTEKHFNNLNRIFQKTEHKLDSLHKEGGEVPPRVLKHILDEGGFIDNEFSAEYFSGVLASSKSTISRDDRALVLLRTLEGMSNYEIRLHYLLYRTYREVFQNHQSFCLSKEDMAMKLSVFIPDASLIALLELEAGENVNQILEYSIPGLANRGLIQKNYRFGSSEWLNEANKKIESAGLISCPSLLGAQLFLAAHGQMGISGNSLCDHRIKLNNLDGIGPCKGAFHVN